MFSTLGNLKTGWHSRWPLLLALSVMATLPKDFTQIQKRKEKVTSTGNGSKIMLPMITERQ